MTEQGKKVLMLLIEGKNYAEIGAELGITKQGAYSCAMNAIGRRRNHDLYHYQNLVKYIDDNCMSVREFAKQAGVGYQTMSMMLIKGAKPAWNTIMKISKCSGLPVEVVMDDGNMG